MRYILVIWITSVLLTFRQGSCREEAGDVQAPEDEDSFATSFSNIVADLHNVYNGRVENLHADLNKRLVRRPVLKPEGKAKREDVLEDEEDPYAAQLSDIVAGLHRVYSGKTENLYADLHKRSNTQRKRNVQLAQESGEMEDPFTTSLSNMVAHLHRVYSGKMENLHADFNKRFTEQEKRFADLERKYDDLVGAMNGKSRIRRQDGERVAFYTQLTRDVDHIGNFQPIVFDHVTTNIGKGYNQADGIFTAPQTGVYVFSWTGANQVHSHMQTELVVNSVIEGRTWSDSMDHDDVSVASNTVVLSLTQGDTVWIRSNSVHSAKIMGQSMTTFSGWLLL